MGRTGLFLDEPVAFGTVSEGTECETILFPMRNGKDLEKRKGVMFERLRKTELKVKGEERWRRVVKKLIEFWRTD
ncbi:hypothetical protein TNCV_1830911 [Trichonephila clavipes]|nr:hypothetical protein TNCV_1830911 [Trichonephila clavipes]